MSVDCNKLHGRLREICEGSAGITEEKRQRYLELWANQETRTPLAGGPGTELAKIIPGLLRSTKCDCRKYARKMDRWGADGCEQRFERIVAHLIDQAKKHSLVYLFGSRPAKFMARRWVRQAIDAAKYGLEPEDPDYAVDQWPFVWTYWAGGAVGDELRYSIASVRRWQPDARVVVIGDRPDWYDGEFIHKPRIKKRPHHAFKDCYSKLLAAAERFSRFVWMMDDVYWIKPFSVREAATPKYVRHVSQQRFRAWNPSNKWGRTRQEAYDWLLANHHPTYDFAAHLPQPIESESFLANETELRLMEHYRNWECLYYNRYHAASAEDWGRRFARINRVVDRIDTPHKVLNHTHTQFEGTVERFLQEMFPEAAA